MEREWNQVPLPNPAPPPVNRGKEGFQDYYITSPVVCVAAEWKGATIPAFIAERLISPERRVPIIHRVRPWFFPSVAMV